MRISALEEDPGFIPRGNLSGVKIFVDDKLIPLVLTADDVLGEVESEECNELGRPVVVNDHIKTIKTYGKVRIEMTDEQRDFVIRYQRWVKDIVTLEVGVDLNVKWWAKAILAFAPILPRRVHKLVFNSGFEARFWSRKIGGEKE